MPDVLTPPLAARIGGLTANGLARLLNEGQRSGALDLAVGVPGAPATPEPLVEAARGALADGVHQYEAPDGNVRLRQWIASTLATPADPATELTVTTGATEALFIALMAVSNPGQEVVMFEPVFENFLNATVLCGCVPKIVRLRPPGWTYDKAELEAAVGPNTCAILFSTPNNPTGHVSSPDELAHLGTLAARVNCALIADEVYARFTFGESLHVSVADVPALRDRSLVVGSFSKSHAISGWRLGFLRAPARLTAAARMAHNAITAGAASPLQAAFATVGEIKEAFAVPGDDLSNQRDRLLAMFSALGLECFEPEGGCYFMADLAKLPYADADGFVRHLVDAAGVMVAPGRFFYARSSGGERQIRVAFNRSHRFLDEIERRLAALAAPSPRARQRVRAESLVDDTA